MGAEDKKENKGKERRWPYWLLGFYLVFILIFATIQFIYLWPGDISTDLGKEIKSGIFMVFGKTLPIGKDARVILIVLLAGVIGSSIHVMTSFSTYIGNRSEKESWLWWYYLRPFIGMALAFVFYCVLRGGFLASGSNVENMNLYGIVAVASLVGIFSKQATDKLREIFDNLFRTESGKGDDVRLDKLWDKKLVRDVMIPVEKIVLYSISKNENESDVHLTTLYEKFSGIVTRLPVVTDELTLKYLIHESILNKFIAKNSLKDKKEPSSLTLQNIVEDKKFGQLISDSMIFIHPDTPLYEAKLRMEETKHCQDVIITENGTREGKLLGWLPNVDIAKHIQKKSQ